MDFGEMLAAAYDSIEGGQGYADEIPAIAPKNAEDEVDLGILPLVEYPTEFKRNEFMTLYGGMASSAYHMSLADLGISMSARGSTVGNQQIVNDAAQDSGIPQIQESFAAQFTRKVCPAGMCMVWDELNAEKEADKVAIDKEIAGIHDSYINNETLTPLEVLEQLFEKGKITKEQFDRRVSSLEETPQEAPQSDEAAKGWHKSLSNDLTTLGISNQWIKAIVEDSAAYEQRLDDVVTLRADEDIDDLEGEDRVNALVSAMLILYFLLGKRQRRTALTASEKALEASARRILANAGISNVALTRRQRLQLEEDVASLSPDSEEYQASLNAEESADIESVRGIHSESATGLMAWAGGLVAMLEARGLDEQELADTTKRFISSRVQLWRNKVVEFRTLGQLYDPLDREYEWIRTARDSCTDCLFFEGQVKRASEWRQIKNDTGKFPRSRALECNGFNCGCSLRRVPASN